MTDHLWEIHVAGVLPEDVLDEELTGLDVAVQPTTTVLTGRLQDEAALRGVLDRMQSFGLRLVEVRQLPQPPAPRPDPPPEGREAATPLPGGRRNGVTE